MSVLKRYLSWYWTTGRRVFSAIHRFSGAIAGLLFVVAVPLGLSSAEAWYHLDVPLVPPATESIMVAFIGVSLLFALFVFLETLTGIAAWTLGIMKRLFA